MTKEMFFIECINVEVAEFLGWQWHGHHSWPKKTNQFYWKKDDSNYRRLPDYTQDLNAIQDAVLTLSNEIFTNKDGFEWTLRCEYIVQLERIVNKALKYAECNFEIYNATALQRCEALLKTIGKWEDL